MTALLIDTPARARVARRQRAVTGPRAVSRLRLVGTDLPVNSCLVESPRPRVTLSEAAAPATGQWRLTERGLAVLVLGVMLAFGSGVAVVIAQFLAITAG